MIDGQVAVTEDEVGARLSRLASRLDPEASGIARLQRLSGGASQEIWRFDVVGPGSSTPLILRRAPGGARVHSVAVGLDVEAGLITAAAAVDVPVPPVVHVLEPHDGLGLGFVMGFVEGETLGGRIVKAEALAGARAILARQCGEILARIHTIDTNKFPTLPRVTPKELLEQWTQTYRASAAPRPVFEAALRWLEQRRLPKPGAPRLVHGDFRNGNLMIGPEGVRAVLDWEIAHVGDPMEDLGWLCVNSWRFGRSDRPVGGFGAFDDLVEGYEATGSARVDRDAAKWWEVFGTLRWGVICASMTAVFRSEDPTVERAMIARRASETEIDLLRLLAD